MASKPVLLSLFFFMLFAKEASTESIIQLGSRLSTEGSNTSWASSSGHFAFGFYRHGNGFAVGIWLVSPPQNTIVWTSHRDSPPLPSNSTLSLTTSGLQLFPSGMEDQNLTAIREAVVTSASLLDSGNFVLYDNDTVIWQSFGEPTDTILVSQNLTSGANLISSMSKSDHSSGRFCLNFQSDGNLVAYPKDSSKDMEDAYWAFTFGSSHMISLNVSGFLCTNNLSPIFFFGPTINPGKKSENTTSIYRATLDVDGIFRLYEHQFERNSSSSVHILWQTFSDNEKCNIKGFCGLNSYCSNITGNAVCECYPGFLPSKSSGNMFLDCEQNHRKDGCESSVDPTMLYNVTYLEDMSWGDRPYLVTPMKRETCEKSCREDCDCGAVLYSGSNCNKYRLPLIYGTKILNASTMAFLKMPSGNTIEVPSTQWKPKSVVDNKKSLIMTLAITLGCVLLLGLAFAVSIFLTYRRQVHRYTMMSASENLGFTEECSLRSFSFDELVKSTKGFTEEIGRGSFGAVYRGTTGDSNRSVAVKRLERIADEGMRKFQAEVTTIAQTHHRNLVKLIGFCIDGSKKLLVYEYVSNGSLANLLFNNEKRLSWREKLKIALDVARGVLYLHEECEVRIIHCNIKPRNILMDETWTAKISDFGLARLLKPEYSRMKKEDDERSKYLAPEWQKDAPVSVKSDVYSFGTVLLEIVCRRSSIDTNVSSAEEILLSSWVYQCFAAGQLNKLVKVNEGEGEGEGVDWKILERMVKVGLWCVQDDPPLRPSMKNVMLMLEGLKDIPIPPSPVHLVK